MIDKEVLIKTTNCIKSADPNCPKPPTEEKSKTQIYEWIIDNLQNYYNFLCIT